MRDIWPSRAEIAEVESKNVLAYMFKEVYENIKVCGVCGVCVCGRMHGYVCAVYARVCECVGVFLREIGSECNISLSICMHMYMNVCIYMCVERHRSVECT